MMATFDGSQTLWIEPGILENFEELVDHQRRVLMRHGKINCRLQNITALADGTRAARARILCLFIDRAISVQPNFHVTNQNAPSVAQVCSRLDGIPLAIGLAAARVKGLGVGQIASRLNDRFRLLTGGSRTALPRQRILQATIDWSYKLLSEEERVLLRRLSVFVGGWTIEAADQICAGDDIDPKQILDLLLRLVDKSLVMADTERSEPRYHLLETIRQYAQEKLDEIGAGEQTRARHLEYWSP